MITCGIYLTIYACFFPLLDDPSEPQNSRSYQANDKGSCTVHVSWATPRNTAVVDITRYMVHINNSNILNATSISKNSSYSVNQVHCAPHNVTIRAVNRCGQLGQSSPVIMPPLETTPDGREGTADTNTPTPIPNERKSKHCCITLIKGIMS